jgi:hypothetical protein
VFGTSKERIDFLNEAAPDFFASLQSTLWDDVLLHLCRLTDPAKSAGKPNLTLQCLPALISNPSLRKNVEDLLEQAKEKTAFAREWRNRRLAHREFRLVLPQTWSLLLLEAVMMLRKRWLRRETS